MSDIESALRLPDDRAVVTPQQVVGGLRPGVVVHAAGVYGCGAALLAADLAARSPETVLYVAANADAAQLAASDLRYLLKERGSERSVRTLLPSEASPYSDIQPDRRAKMARLATLHALTQPDHSSVVVTTPVGLMRRVPPRSVVAAASLQVAPGQELDTRQVAERLTRAGYLRVPVVEDPGSFAVRGGLIDLWAGQDRHPVRIELYDELVMSIRRFDPDTQRSAEELTEVTVSPVRDAALSSASSARAEEKLRALCDAANYPSSKARGLLEDVVSGRSSFGGDAYLPAFYELESVWSYLPSAGSVLIEDPEGFVNEVDAEWEAALRLAAERGAVPLFPVPSLLLSPEEIRDALRARAVLAAHSSGVAGAADDGVESLDVLPVDAPTLGFHDHTDLQRAVKQARLARGKGSALDPLLERCVAWKEAGLRVTIVARAATQADRVAGLLGHRGVNCTITADAANGGSSDADVEVRLGSLARGVIAPILGRVLLTEEEIFGQRVHRRSAPGKKNAQGLLEDLRALHPGDHVVHVEHGIGKYLGLEKRDVGNGTSVDLLVVEYAGGKLFLPVYRLNQIQKFSGDGAPRIDRLGGQTFAKTKSRVQRKVREMADELLGLYAERASVTKLPLAPPDDEYRAFEAAFPFEETADQAAAIEDVGRDLESETVMDRLVCGDVGFGKTEVALRAAFRVAMQGRQVALLCPTTVLAQQHYLTFHRRFAEYPIEVRSLSRFEGKKESNGTLKGLSEGAVDVLIGTHRVLSKDVRFKDLGLLIVDEEQRFGVTHKERLKQLKKDVDVLTLTATPIPRTLQLAVGGLREMSLIRTAPVDRRAIRTIVSRFEEQTVKEAIERELSRGGQVFYVYNRVEGIYERANRIQQLVPGARVAVGHGQMKESELEKTMLNFIQAESDVLVSTSIIESGLDIPRANTMIVDRADLFGLSQLYQLRGRVGRSRERAYCYLLVPPPSELTEEARSRIEALERYTELGSGFDIASLDMELRGAGNLLGGEQSGTVASVGFELFCQMLQEAVAELRGEEVIHDVDPELSFDVEALLPDDYVGEVGVRLSLYKRFSSAADEDNVERLAQEMEDRFGPPPPAARALVELMRIKTELRTLRVLSCEATAKGVTLRLREDTPLNADAVLALVQKRKGAYRLTPDMRLIRKPTEKEGAHASGLALASKMLGELAELLDTTG